jgi:hypothetical protein
MSILSLLGKAGKRVFSPATKARNLIGEKNFKAAQGIVRAAEQAQAKSLQHATAKVDDLIRRGEMPDYIKREDLIRKMQQHLEREYAILKKGLSSAEKYSPNIDPASALMALKYPGSNFTAFPAELIRKLGDKAVWAALGIGGAAGYGIGARAEDDAVEEMEEETQLGPVKGYFKDVGFGERDWESGGEATANLLMDIISPIPRQ